MAWSTILSLIPTRPMARITMSGTQSFPSGTPGVLVQFWDNADTFETDPGMTWTGQGMSRIVVPKAGWYWVGAQLTTQAAFTGEFRGRIDKNGVIQYEQKAPGSGASAEWGSAMVNLGGYVRCANVNDYLEVRAWHNARTSQTLVSSTATTPARAGCSLTARWVAAL